MAQLFHIPCLLYFGVLGGTPDPENFCQKVYWATLLYKQKQFADRVQDFLIESETSVKALWRWRTNTGQSQTKKMLW